MPVPLTVTCFIFAVLLAAQGLEVESAAAGLAGVINQALVSLATSKAVAPVVAPDPEGDYLPPVYSEDGS
jgi:hypothetical protein